MFNWWNNRIRRRMEREYPLKTPVYVRHYSKMFTGTVAGWDGVKVLVRTTVSTTSGVTDLKLYDEDDVTSIEDKVERINAEV